MNILVIGLNHKTASIDIREKFAFDGEKLEVAAKSLNDSRLTVENVILSTCNRVEVYARVRDLDSGIKDIKGFLADFHHVPEEALNQALFTLSGREAVRHIFRVASGLDSMVLGEPQILGQMKDAFDFAIKNKATGIFLNKLMKKTFSVAKRTRTETGIGKGAVNISYAAVELAKKIFEDLATKTFLLIGAGEMGELAAKHLINNGVRDVIVTNRTYERAVKLAAEFHGRTVRFEEYMNELKDIDIIISAVDVRKHILTKDDIRDTMKARKQKPVYIIDISDPRSIDPQIDKLDNVYRFDIDDLRGIVDVNEAERRKEAEKADDIVNAEIESFMKWQESLSAVPTIVALREMAEAIRAEELEKTLKKLGPMDEVRLRSIDQLTSSIVNKLIHPPTATLKSENEDRELLVDMVRRLFHLEVKKD
jgi:glutamyl-tRNA reductase